MRGLPVSLWALSPIVLQLFGSSIPVGAQPANPSFNCAKATLPDERTICADERLAEMDRAVSNAFAQVKNESKEDATTTAKEALAARHACGTNKLCILDQQAKELETFSDLGSKIPVPSWLGAYRVSLFKAQGSPATAGMPARVGACTVTKIASLTTRFGEALKPPAADFDPGSAVTFANRGYQVSYSYMSALADSQVGDEVLVCLVSIPKNCPRGDDRGKFYASTNLRTNGTWVLPDAQHMCGGA
jgi:uncharacterized protein